MRILPIKTRTGHITAKVNNGVKEILLHSRFDPLKESGRLINNYSLEKDDIVIIFGVGLGYHVSAVLNKLGASGQVYVFQLGCDMFRMLNTVVDFSPVKNDPRVTLFVADGIPQLAAKMSEVFNRANPEKVKVIIHRPSLEVLPLEAIDLKEALEDWVTKSSTQRRFSDLLKNNLEANKEFCSKTVTIDVLCNKFLGIPAILVSAGPSLDKEKQNLQDLAESGKSCIISVGTALKTLVSWGVKPHLAVITDPQEVVFNQLKNIKEKIPLIVLPTVHPKLLQAGNCPVILAVQDDEWVKEQIGISTGPVVETGGSVATTMLDIAIKMGHNPIVFVGLDLAYPEGKTHASDTMYKDFFDDVRMEEKFLRRVKSNAGEYVHTSKVFDLYRQWIEERISRESGIRFINTSSAGAFIVGTEVASLREITGQLPAREGDVGDLVKRAMAMGEKNKQ